MTDFTQIISFLLESLRKGGDVTIKEWPSDAPFSPAEMGLLEEAGKLFCQRRLSLLRQGLSKSKSLT